MTIKATFVGINKHLDPAIPELSGARRDAMVLWTLFTDTIDGLFRRRATRSHARDSERGGDAHAGHPADVPRSCVQTYRR